MPPPSALASVALLQAPMPAPASSLSWASPHLAPIPATTPGLGTGSHYLTPAPIMVPGLSLSPATAPLPQKLVDKIRSGQFVEMKELLTDNVSLLQQLDTFGNYAAPTLPGVLKPRLREVTSLPTWLYCFLAYIAVRAGDPCTAGICPPRYQGGPKAWGIGLVGLRPGVPSAGGY